MRSSLSCLPLGVHLSECRGLCSRLAAGVGCRCTRAPRIPHPSEQHIRVLRNIAMSECRIRHVLMFLNIFVRHNAGRMYGNILLAECSSASSCLWCRRTTLGGESSGRLGTRYATRARTCFSHSDFIRLPSTQHIPTTVILCIGCLGCVAVSGLGRVAVGNLGVVPSGLSPHGAASFVHARLGCRGTRVA